MNYVGRRSEPRDLLLLAHSIVVDTRADMASVQRRVRSRLAGSVRRLRKRAVDRGYEAGIAEGRARAFQELRALVDLHHEVRVDALTDATEVIFTLLGELLGKTLKKDPSLLQERIARAIATFSTEKNLTLIGHPRLIRSLKKDAVWKVKALAWREEEDIPLGQAIISSKWAEIRIDVHRDLQVMHQSLAQKLREPS
jgi:flagellar biosynthesis/type III secretory pathway protein FliH